jgi:hypothetical protein
MASSGNGRRLQLGRVGHRPYAAVWFSVLCRAIHQLGAGLLLAALIFTSVGAPPGWVWWLTAVSGVLLVVLEWWRHRELYREVAGVATAVKLLLVVAAIHGLIPQLGGLLAVFMLAAVAAHVPKDIRHRVIIGPSSRTLQQE